MSDVRRLARAVPKGEAAVGLAPQDALFGQIDGGLFTPFVNGDWLEPVPLDALTLIAPVVPTKIVGVALNYKAHAAEMGKPLPEEPMFFLKPTTSLVGPEAAIVLPPDSQLVHHEAELGIVLSRPLRNATPDEARAAILGLVCVNDVTARDIQRRQQHYTRSKGFDTFCPIGPVIAAGLDPSDLRVQCRVNGELRQDGRTSDMVFGPFELLSFLSRCMTLLPGDVVSTGTPPGVDGLRPGDVCEIEVEGVGVLRNPVVAGS